MWTEFFAQLTQFSAPDTACKIDYQGWVGWCVGAYLVKWSRELQIGCKLEFAYQAEPKGKKMDQTDHLGTLADHFC